MKSNTDDYGVFHGSELHLHISGSISASLVPWWIHWFRTINQKAVVHASVSRSASRFVTKSALESLCNGRVWNDEWDDVEAETWRQGGNDGVECIFVFPATLDTMMRLAQGRSDSPALMMMQISKRPIIVCETIPAPNPVTDYWREQLLSRHNVVAAPPVVGFRATDRGSQESGFNLPGAIAIANSMLSSQDHLRA